jgi:coenzyme F420-0:L-glutamate ligase/coenzyme F420-1:gamma-L-glutamate ligase
MLCALALEGLPEVQPGDGLADLIVSAIDSRPPTTGPPQLTEGDLLVIAHKIVSKSEGRIRSLGSIVPGALANELSERLAKDPRHVQAVLDESSRVLRAERGVLICVTHHGFVCANAGVDASNIPGSDDVVLLPHAPDCSARRIRRRLRELTGVRIGIMITDSFGRAWRNGQAEVAIGCAGLSPLEDWRGRRDAYGRELRATWIAVADQLASAADLARRKDGSQPVVLIRGANRHLTDEDGPGAAAMIRPEAEDLFR